MKSVLFIIGIFLVNDAHAYLDPGSGNALVCLFLSLIGAFFYYLKSFFYRIVLKIKGEQYTQKLDEQIALFSEGKNYWYTYKPIVEKLIDKKIPFIYYTMDFEDPALRIDNEFMHSKYVGSGNRGFAKIGSLKTKLLITTTPNIGCPEYPLRKPSKVMKLCHIWHSICDSSCYHLGALDYYDVALTVGNWVEEPLRTVEQIRKIRAKEVIPVGLPYFDELKKIYDRRIKDKSEDKQSNSDLENKQKVLLLAPSWGAKSCLKTYGTDFIHKAIEKGYHIILRPHPQTVKVESDFLKKLQNEFKYTSQVEFDLNPDATDSMLKSDMMISDKSGVRFDYALIYEKPVLTLDVPATSLDEYEAILLGRLWGEDEAKLIGLKLQPNQKEQILEAINQTILFKASDIKKIRENVLVNYGYSTDRMVEWIETEIREKNN
ncbi:CDP-glycerol glycerophosphotransferase family protein [Succinivibrio sp.]|uniref:CDP-glycerol glycerophosphotransferase family protein n=1 Tax=Succinivibrio sp. TaxID=2053619 RepID=UPI0025DD87A2|nr:CDP-glycerol glycerophosphotransferase family protein [Succinivibrio sp.]MBQ9219653.1 CDP-glycerol glycerophosphotransferase family protein [Succinivibrio sp.]